jgi:Spy/CpxP family protein refolding chaperone
MKKIFLMLAVTGAFALAGYAQNPKTGTAKPASEGQGKGGKHETPEQRAQQSVDRLDEIVSLTAEQKTQIYNLALTRAKTVDSIREKYKGQPDKKEQAKQEMQSAHKEYRQSVKKLLTPEQMKKLKEHHKANKGKGAEEDLPTEQD